MVKVCLAVLVGLPGAGKTTFCKQLIEKDLSFSVVHVCYDNFVNINFEMYKSFKLQRQDVLRDVRELISSFGEGLPINLVRFQESTRLVQGSDKLLILIDDNNFYRSMRYEYYKLTKELGAIFCQVCFTLPLQIAIARNSQRSNTVPIEIIIQMNNLLEPPSKRYKWEARVFTIQNGDYDYSEFLEFLNSCFDLSMEAQKVSNIKAVEQSQVHKVDLLLRKRIGELMRCFSSKIKIKYDVNTVAANLNAKRKHILEDIRSGVIVLETDEDYEYLISLI